ncbi:hypothetical protein MMC13_001028 [Lambiella insularis]|nr:hypothetical protein [Lambiella insularis]
MADSTAPKAAPPPGERLASYFENFFRTIVGVSTLGASITFSQIISSPVAPRQNFGFDQVTVQWFLAIAWLFFFLALAVTSLFASLLSLYRPQAVEYFGTTTGHNRRTVMWYATFASSLLFLLAVLAFIFVGLVVVAYAGPVGWIAVGFCVTFGTFGFGFIIYRSPLFAREESWKDRRRRTTDPVLAHMKLHKTWDEKPGSGNWGTMPNRKTDSYWQKDGTTVPQSHPARYTRRTTIDPRRYDDKRHSGASTTVSENLDEIPRVNKSSIGDDIYEDDLWGKNGAVFHNRYRGQT